MKACVIHEAERVVIEVAPSPVPKAGQLLLSFAFGGICGSDIHYYQHGRVGDSILLEPMVMGHEFSAVVIESGAGVDGFSAGDKVAVTPALPCLKCDYCKRDLSNLCTDMLFMGSAARVPHCNGGFASELVVDARQCIKLPEDADLRHVAMAEPYAVALHAVAMAGDVSGATVLVTGAGVIGQMCASAARAAGATRILMSDIAPAALERAKALGVDEVFDARDSKAMNALTEQPFCDVVFEASGAAPALNTAIAATKPRGTVVQVGFLPPKAPVDLAKLLTREISLVGTYRFIDEFAEAVRQIVSGEVDLRPMISADMSLDAPDAVFARALDKTDTLKVMVHF
ncbi:L-idonate 5-dehydrogenase [Pacificibacter marinus]|uniref:L-idonate 5-dehydrogenase (NAD(P)(+)) n=1 Tax=Pacificibacter marinus TaxID=658057 RepID=A0A1Y5S1X7_9RHOB|nr:L-idonate 5-dehydrogenase [Pacificibacter marinus]SEK34729.1 (R,R)-butanediol dehydrogenase / meso-butanediol dehydrogenase / diacetyl reductase [Pacificibacter marinus]SLN27810.1 L-idonate 5-dehydrogenase (NAD(P)(+)) [Pacificibacter marinus]